MKKLSLADLESVYQQSTFGNEEPTHIRLNPVYEKQMLALFIPFNRPGRPPLGTNAIRVGGAVVVFSSEVSVDTIETVNVKWLHNPHYNLCRSIEGREVCSACGREM